MPEPRPHAAPGGAAPVEVLGEQQRGDALSAVDHVTLELRRLIVSGDLAAGSEFSLREMAHRLGTSFIPIREALRRLEAEGLVISPPGRSSSVTPLSTDDVRGIYRLRRILEPEILSRSALLLTPEHYARLEELLDALADSTRTVDEHHLIHHEFHRLLLEPAATPWDLRIIDSLQHAGERYIRHTFDPIDADANYVAERDHAHRSLLAAMRLREPAAAAQAGLAHLVRNEERAFRAVATPTLPSA